MSIDASFASDFSVEFGGLGTSIFGGVRECGSEE